MPAATLVKAACAFNGVGNDATMTVMRENALKTCPNCMTSKTKPAEEGFQLTEHDWLEFTDALVIVQGLL